jgi:hypothetical protein
MPSLKSTCDARTLCGAACGPKKRISQHWTVRTLAPPATTSVSPTIGGAVDVLSLPAIAAQLEVAALGLGHPTPALMRRYTQSGRRRESRVGQG